MQHKNRAAIAPPAPDVPEPLRAALATHPAAALAFAALPPSHRQEYADWVAEAKRPQTSARRAEKALAMILEKSS